MPRIHYLPGMKRVQVPDDATDEQIIAWATKKGLIDEPEPEVSNNTLIRNIWEPALATAWTAPGLAMAGTKQLAASAFDDDELLRSAIKDQIAVDEERSEIHTSPVSATKALKLAGDGEYLEAAKEIGAVFTQAAAGSAPEMVIPMTLAATGHPVLAAAALFAQHVLHNANRQAGTMNAETATTEDQSVSGNIVASGVNTALDSLTFKMLRLEKLIPSIKAGRIPKADLAEEAGKIKSLAQQLDDGAGKVVTEFGEELGWMATANPAVAGAARVGGMSAWEGLVEGVQAVSERAQAGLSLGDQEAFEEYFNNFAGGLGAGLVFGAGGEGIRHIEYKEDLRRAEIMDQRHKDLSDNIRNIATHKANVEMRMEEAKASALADDIGEIKARFDNVPSNEELLEMASDLNIKTGSQTPIGVDAGWMSFLKRSTGKMYLDDKNMTDADRWTIFKKLKSMAVQPERRSFAVNTKEEITEIAKKLLKSRGKNKNDTAITIDQVNKILNLDEASLAANDINDTYAQQKRQSVMEDLARFGYARQIAGGGIETNFHHTDAKGKPYYGLMDGSDNQQYLDILATTISRGKPPTMKELGMRSVKRYRSIIDRMVADGQIYEYSKNKYATTDKSDGTQGKAYSEEYIPGTVKTFTVRDALGNVVRTANSQAEADSHAKQLSEADAPWDVWVGGKKQRYKTKSAAINAANKINNRTPWTVRIGKRHVGRFENENQANMARVNEINRITNEVRKSIEANMTPQQVRSAGALINSTLRDMGPRIADSVKVDKTKARTKQYISDAKKHYGSKQRQSVNRVRHKRTDDAGSVLDVKDEFFDSIDQAEQNARERSGNIVSDTIDTLVEGREEVIKDKQQRINLARGRIKNRENAISGENVPQKLREIVDGIKKKYGVDIDVLFRYRNKADKNLEGLYHPQSRTISVDQSIIDMYDLNDSAGALELSNRLNRLLSHEFIHYLRDSGAITPRQWAILLKAAKDRDATVRHNKPEDHKGKYTFYDIARSNDEYKQVYDKLNLTEKERVLRYEEEAVTYFVDAIIADQIETGNKSNVGAGPQVGIINKLGHKLKGIVSFLKKGGFETPESLIDSFAEGKIGQAGVVNPNKLDDTLTARLREEETVRLVPEKDRMELEQKYKTILDTREEAYVEKRNKENYNFEYDPENIESDTADIQASTAFASISDMLEAVDEHYGDTNPIADHPINIVTPDTVDSVIYIDGKPVAVRMKHDGNELSVNRIIVGENYGETLPAEVGGGVQPVGRGAKLDEIAHVLHYDGSTVFASIGSESTYDSMDADRKIANAIIPVKPNVWKAFDGALNIDNITNSIRNWGETKVTLGKKIGEWAHKKEIEFLDRRIHGSFTDERVGNDPFATTSAYSALLNADDALSYLNGDVKYGTMTYYEDGHTAVEDMDLDNLDGIDDVFDGKSYGIDTLRNEKAPYSKDNKIVGGYEIIITPLLNDVNGHPRRSADGKSEDLINFWHTYRAAKRGERLMEGGKLVPMSETEIKEGLAFAEKYPVLKVVDHNFNKWNNGHVKFLVDTEVVTKDQAEQWTKHGDWLPFYVDLEGRTPENEKAQKLLEQLRRKDKKNRYGKLMFNKVSENNPLESPYRGHDLDIQDPMVATLMNAQAAIKSGLYNIAAKRIAENEIKAKTAEDITFLKDEDGNILTDKKGKPVRTPDNLIGDAIRIRVKGEDRHIRFEDPLTFDLMLGTLDQANPVPDWMQAPSRVYRSMVTRWPAFAMKNVSRDSLASWGLTGADMRPIIDSVDQFRKDLSYHIKTGRYPEGHKTLEKAGAAGGGYEHQGLDAGAKGMVKNILKNKSHLSKGLLPSSSHKDQTIFQKGIDAWDRLGEWAALSETATRQIVYEYVLKKTGDPGRAATAAREVLNFSRRGSNRFARMALPMYPFLNSRFQGQRLLYKQGIRGTYSPIPKELQGTDTVWGLTKEMPISRSAMYKRAMYYTGGMMLYAALLGDQDWYKYGITEHARDNTLPVPTGTGITLILPVIPWELGLTFGTWPMQLTHAALGRQDFKDALGNIAGSAAEQMEFNWLPQIIRPAGEAITNHSFLTGREIVTKGQLGPEAYGPETDRTSVLLGQAFGVSPEKITHILKGYFGTVGSAVLMTLDAMQRTPGLNQYTGATTTPLSTLSLDNLATMPIFKAFMQNGMTKRGSTEGLEFRKMALAANELGTKIKRARVVSPESVPGLIEDHRKLKSVMPHIARIESAIRKINQREKDTRNNPALSRSVKHDRLERLSDARMAMLKNIDQLQDML